MQKTICIAVLIAMLGTAFYLLGYLNGKFHVIEHQIPKSVIYDVVTIEVDDHDYVYFI